MDRQKMERKTYTFLGKAAESVRLFRSSGRMQTLVDNLFCFGVTVILSRGQILNAYAPFGISFVVAACSRGNGFAAAIGAFFGYILLGSGSSGLSSGAAVLMTVVMGHVFGEKFHGRIFMPLAGMVAGLLTYGPFIAWESSGAVLSFLCCGAIIFGAAYFYQMALSDQRTEKSLKISGWLVLAATVLIAAYPITWFDLIHPARALAALFVMAVAYMTGHTGGAACGVALGITMDAARGSGMFFTCIYGFSGMISGVFHKNGRMVFACSFLIAAATASLLGIEHTDYLSVLCECLMTVILFLVLPEGIWLWMQECFASPHPKTAEYVWKVRKTAKNYIWETANAFHEMYLGVMGSLQKRRGLPEECVGDIYRRAADTVCKKCELAYVCWEKEYVSTLNALNDASAGLLKGNSLKPEDFPTYFSTRCVHFPEFMEAIHESYRILRQRQQYQERIQENKGLVAEQYAGLTGVLRQIGDFMGAGPEFLPNWEDMLRKYAAAFGTVEHAAAYRDPFGRVCMEIAGDLEETLTEEGSGFAAGLSALIGVPLGEPRLVRDEMGSRYMLREKEKLRAVFAQAEKSKDGISVNGDCAVGFLSDDGKAYLILADGMGTGAEARQDSSIAIQMLARFLKAGISMADAVKTISPAIRIRNDEEGFLALDAVGVNLFSGECEMLKCSSAAVYVCQQKQIRRIIGKGLPFGILYGEGERELLHFSLAAGDRILLVSDGICDGTNDGWLLHLLETEKPKRGEDLVQLILQKAHSNSSTGDDKTVCLLELEENP